MKATDVAKWFYKNNEQTKKDNKDGNVVMQKLCYYAQAMYLAIYNKPLFEEKIEAWENGPVVKDVYNLYRWFHYSLKKNDNIAILPEEEKVLRVINSVYGFKTSYELIESTHKEKPWKQFEDIAKERNNNPEITKKVIKEYYSDLVDVYEANKDNDFYNERMYKYLNCNFIYNIDNIKDISKYYNQLNEIAKKQSKPKSFNIYVDEGNELVVYA